MTVVDLDDVGTQGDLLDGSPFADRSDTTDKAVPLTDDLGPSASSSVISELNLTGATISQEWSYTPSASEESEVPPRLQHRRKDAPSILLPHQSEYVSHIALDIGGSLIKLVYFSRDHIAMSQNIQRGGKLHFVKFETHNITECIDFIVAKGLHRRNGSSTPMRVKATGGGAYKYADVFREKLGLILEREDEMACMVDGCNFLLKAVQHEAFTYENGQLTFVDIDPAAVYPYLLVNIGSGVSMVRVDGEGKHQRVSGTNIGGGTFWGLCRLLTGKKSFDEILELSSQGDNSKVDMLVGDIYGGRDYASIGLSANTIASSFGKVMYCADKNLDDYSPSDIAMSLCRMISYNIGQLAYLNAKRYNLPRIFFGGFFIRGHPYTMETISFAIRFWSQGEMGAMFLRHEGFLGAVGAFMRVQQQLAPLVGGEAGDAANKVRARFVERFSMGAPVMGGRVQGPAIKSVTDKITWVEKFLAIGRPATEAAAAEHERAALVFDTVSSPMISRTPSTDIVVDFSRARSKTVDLNLGVLHFTPGLEPFPLLADPPHYNPNTIDINTDAAEMQYWVGVLQDGIPTVVEKAAASESNAPEAVRRAAAFGRAFDSHLVKLRSEPGAYGQLGLADLFELREDCLREFGFEDVYVHDKERENAAALEVLPDLLQELDSLQPEERLLSLVQGVLAANIFDWGAKACVELYLSATILEMYREARTKLSKRPWKVDHLDEFSERWSHTLPSSFYKRAIMFVDNAGADVVLGMLPFARELLRVGCEVVLVANSLPAINDITVSELKSVVAKAAEVCPIIKAARDAAVAAEAASGGRVPPLAGLGFRVASFTNLAALAQDQELPTSGLTGGCPSPSQPRSTIRPFIDGENLTTDENEATVLPRPIYPNMENSPLARRPSSLAPKGMFGESYPSPWREPRLYVVASGSGSPCLDLRRVSADVADATVGADLVIIEGMGRAIHTNMRTKLQCDVLKLAMIKNSHLAERVFGGEVYDCMCRFDRGTRGLA